MAEEMHRTQFCTIGSTDTLLIRTRMSRGDVYTLEARQTSRTFDDIQELIYTLTDERQTVISVWRIEANELSGAPILVEDLTEEFDVRSAAQISEDTKRTERDAAKWAITQASNGTLNHTQQGIGR